MGYRCEVASIAGFVQQVAVSYLTHGYVFYSAGVVPEGKDPRLVDEKLVQRYGLEISKWTRARRKREGIASVSYLRHLRFFVLLATPGRHPFFEGEAKSIRDFRREPLKFASYAISVKNGHPHVRIAEPTMRDLKAYFAELSTRRSRAQLEAALHSLPFEPWAPVRRQFFELLRLINRHRAIASLEPVAASCLRLRRRPLQVFSSEPHLESPQRTPRISAVRPPSP
jgi:hypothetical protein